MMAEESGAYSGPYIHTYAYECAVHLDSSPVLQTYLCISPVLEAYK